MVILIEELEIKAGKEESFMASFASFRDIFLSLPGGLLTRLLRDQAAPASFSLLLQWETKDAQKLCESDDRFKVWFAQVLEALAGKPRAHYFDEVL
jgi:quinol monooxygenase YgiN